MGKFMWGHALAAAVGGYMQGQKMARANADDEADAAWKKDSRARQSSEWADADSLKNGLKAASEQATVQSDVPTLDLGDGGAPKVYEMPKGVDAQSVVATDARQARSMAEQVGAPPPTADIGTTNSVRGVGYDTPAMASKAADAYNAPPAVAGRQIMALQKAGKPMEALQLQGAQRQGEAGDLQLQQSQQAAQHDKMFRDVVGQFQQGGWSALPKIYEGYKDGNSAQVVEDGKGGATVTKIGPDGQALGKMSFATPMDFITGQVAKLDPKLWVGMETHRMDKTQAQANADRTFKLHEDGQNATISRAVDANSLKRQELDQKHLEKIPENSSALRKEFEALPETKNYKQAIPAYRGIEDAVKRNTPMSDINIVYGIAKLYDPNSVVREGEYATVASAPAMPERVKGWVQYVAGGGKLTDKVKEQILTEAKSRMKTFEDELGTSRTRYQDIARRSNADPSLVISNEFMPAVKTGAAAKTAAPDIAAEMRRRGLVK